MYDIITLKLSLNILLKVNRGGWGRQVAKSVNLNMLPPQKTLEYDKLLKL